MVMMSYTGAIDEAIATAMGRDERVLLIGEDVQLQRRPLYLRFGKHRVRNTPISESAILGAGLGAAMSGLRPIVEIMFVDFIGVAMDVLLNHVAKVTAFSGGEWPVPLVVRMACGGGYGDAGQHEQALWGMLAGIPGLTVVAPATPDDAAGLMLSAVADSGPVMFLEHKLLTDDVLDYVGGAARPAVDLDIPRAGAAGDVPAPPVAVPLGAARLRRSGAHLVIVSVSVGVHRALAAAEELAREGIEAAVLDLRTIAPLDRDALLDVAGATGRVLVVDEDYIRGGLTGEIAATLAENDVPVRFARLATETTIPYALALERQTLPSVERIVASSRRLLADGTWVRSV